MREGEHMEWRLCNVERDAASVVCGDRWGRGVRDAVRDAMLIVQRKLLNPESGQAMRCDAARTADDGRVGYVQGGVKVHNERNRGSTSEPLIRTRRSVLGQRLNWL
jgi:hypothetical protein